MKNNSNDINSMIEFAEEAMKSKKWPEAVIRWQALFEKFQRVGKGGAYVRLSIAYRNQNLFNQADRTIYEGIEKHPTSLPIFMEYAKIAIVQKNWTEATKRLQKVVDSFDPTTYPQAFNIAEALEYKNKQPFESHCNICGSPFFVSMNSRKNVKCFNCGSLERTRLLYLYIKNFPTLFPNSQVLHFAPEEGLYNKISSIVSPGNYSVVDLDPNRYSFAKNVQKFDLCNDIDDLPDNYFDLIIHSHIMEHIPCNISYVLKSLHRSLKDDGWHICVIPFLSGYYEECFAPLSAEEAQSRFGQFDHVRRFGIKDIHNTLGRIIPIDINYDVTKIFPPETLIKFNIPEYCWKGLTPNTVLALRKNDINI
jgi:phosphoglycolate phosphatase